MEQAIIDAIKPYIVQLLVARLAAAIPRFGLTFFNGLAGIIVGWVVGYVLAAAQKFLNFEIVDFVTSEEQAAYVDAKNQILAVQGSSDPAAIAKARAAFSAALGPLIKLDTDLPGVISS